MRSINSSDRRLLIGCAANGVLAAAVGALAGGVRGAQIGVVVGLALGTLPTLAESVAAALARPNSLPRRLAAPMAAGAVAVATALVRMAGALLEPVSRVLGRPRPIVRCWMKVLGRATDGAWRTVGQRLATPLGLANLAALAILAIDLGGLDFAGPALLAGLAMLLIVLVVSASEARDA